MNLFQEKFRMTKHCFIFISDNFKYYGGTDYDSRKILNTYMNRIAIDENDQHEILSYHELPDTSDIVESQEKIIIDENDQNPLFSYHELKKLENAPDDVDSQEKIDHDMNIVDKARSLIYHS